MYGLPLDLPGYTLKENCPPPPQHSCQDTPLRTIQGLIVSFPPCSRKEKDRKKPLHAPEKPRNTLYELKASRFPTLNTYKITE